MDLTVTFIILLGCRAVCSSPGGHSDFFSMDFSPGTHLQVGISQETAVCDEDDELLPNESNNSTGSFRSSTGPSVQILSSARLSQDPGSPHLLVCLLNGLKSQRPCVLWWVDDVLVTSAGAEGPWTESEDGYSATSVWEVSAADWRPTSSYWCGTIQQKRVYRQKLCSED